MSSSPTTTTVGGMKVVPVGGVHAPSAAGSCGPVTLLVPGGNTNVHPSLSNPASVCAFQYSRATPPLAPGNGPPTHATFGCRMSVASTDDAVRYGQSCVRSKLCVAPVAAGGTDLAKKVSIAKPCTNADRVTCGWKVSA